MAVQHIFTGTTAPATTPSALGQHYIDTVAGKNYISTGTSSSADWTLNLSNPTGDLKIASGSVLKVNNIQILTSQQAAVADATNGTDVITQLNALLARLRTHGVIAT